MQTSAHLHSLLAGLHSCTTLNEAVNTLAQVTSDYCRAAYSLVYLRDYTGENRILSGRACICPVTPTPAYSLSDIEHPLVYCLHTGKSLTLPISSLENTYGTSSNFSTCAHGSTPQNTAPHTITHDSFFPLLAPDNVALGTLVIGHTTPCFGDTCSANANSSTTCFGDARPLDTTAIGILCLYASAVISNLINTCRSDALVHSLHEDLQRLSEQEKAEVSLAKRVMGTSKAIGEIRKATLLAATCPTSVFISGETGTGKNLVARAIHDIGSRKSKPFIEINCAAIPHDLFESELFGHVEGAFSGATTKHNGLLRAADGGTVFLDELAELPTDLQASLLQVIQDKTVRPVGGLTSHPIDVRIVAATNKDIEHALRQGLLREDLYHRLSGLTIHLPPLRERPEDSIHLAQHFFTQFAQKYDKKKIRLDADAIFKLSSLPLPGNVRELANLLEQAIISARNGAVITAEDIVSHNDSDFSATSLSQRLEAYEKALIATALAQCNGDALACAKTLAVHPKTLSRRIAKYALTPTAGERIL